MTTYRKLTEAKAKLSELVEEANTTHEEVVITRNGEPVAVIISFDQLESLRETMAVLADPEAMARIRETETDHARGDFAEPVTKEELLAEIRAAAVARREQGPSA